MTEQISTWFSTTPINELIGLSIFIFLMMIFTMEASKSFSRTVNGVSVKAEITNYNPGRIFKLIWIVLSFYISIWYVVAIQIFTIYLVITRIQIFKGFILWFQPSDKKVNNLLDKKAKNI